MNIKLNKKQKQFLFDNYYVDAKVLDALIYKGWQNYYIDNFTWILSENLNMWNMRTLTIFNSDNEIYEQFDLNFQGNDFIELKRLV